MCDGDILWDRLLAMDAVPLLRSMHHSKNLYACSAADSLDAERFHCAKDVINVAALEDSAEFCDPVAESDASQEAQIPQAARPFFVFGTRHVISVTDDTCYFRHRGHV